MGMLFTTGQAAKQIGRGKSSVQRAANRLGIGLQSPVGLLLTEAEIQQVAEEIKPVGSPIFTPGNDLWRRRKKAKKSTRKSR